jgi:hypothetical protein
MSNIVKVRRGTLASLPVGEAGEFLTTSDTHQAFFGDGTTNYELKRAFISVHQVAHGLSVGNVIYCSGANTYAKAKADALATSDVIGVVSTVIGADDFVFCAEGTMVTGVPAVAAGTVLFLSDATAGLLTATEPNTVGHISIPMAIVTENATSMIVGTWRGLEIASDGIDILEIQIFS